MTWDPPHARQVRGLEISCYIQEVAIHRWLWDKKLHEDTLHHLTVEYLYDVAGSKSDNHDIVYSG